MLGRKPRADSGNCTSSKTIGRSYPARRSVQAKDFTVRLPGVGAGRIEAAGGSSTRNRTTDHHRSNERRRCRDDRRIRRYSAGWRKEHAELHLIKEAGSRGETGTFETRNELDHKRIPDVG